MRKDNARRQFLPWIRFLQHTYRKRVETTGSLPERLLSKSIHAVTARGFRTQDLLFVLALSINFLRQQLGLATVHPGPEREPFEG